MDSTPTSQSSLSIDLNTLKQRRYEYKASRKLFQDASNRDDHEPNDNLFSTKHQEPCKSDRAYPVIPLTQTLGTDCTPTNLEDPNAKLFTGYYEKSKERSSSETSHQLIKLHPSPKSSPFTPLTMTPERVRPLEGLEILGIQTPKTEVLKRGPMTPEGKRHNGPNILQKGLINYRQARQLARSPGSGFPRNCSFQEASKSQEPSRVAVNQSTELDIPKMVIESERRGNIMGLERFYQKNLEVLEEDESHSEDLENRSSGEGDGCTQQQKQKNVGKEVTGSNEKGKPRKGTEGNKIHGKNEVVVENQMNKKVLGQKEGSWRPEKKGAKEKLTGTTNKILKSVIKKAPVENKQKAIKDAKKAQNLSGLPEEPQTHKPQRTIEEEHPKLDPLEDIVKEKNVTVPAMSGAQGTHQGSPFKKLQLNNWTKSPGGTMSANPSYRNSPKAKGKETVVPAYKKPYTVESPKKKPSEPAKSMAVLKKSSTTMLTKEGSSNNIGGFEDLDNMFNLGVPVNENAETKLKPVLLLSQRRQSVRGAEASGDNGKKMDIKPLRLNMRRDSQEKVMPCSFNIETSESERVQGRTSRERDYSAGKHGSTTRENTKRRDSVVKAPADNTDHNTSGTHAMPKKVAPLTNKKAGDDNRASPKRRRMTPEREAHDNTKTPKKSTGNNGQILHTKKSIEVASAVVTGCNTKTSSPTSKGTKINVKPGEIKKEVKAIPNKLTSLKEAKLLKAQKEGEHSKHVLDLKSLSELQMLSQAAGSKGKGIETPNVRSSPQHVQPETQTGEIGSDMNGKEEKVVQDSDKQEKAFDNKEKKKGEGEQSKEGAEPGKIRQNNKGTSNLKIPTHLLKALGLPFPLHSSKNV